AREPPHALHFLGLQQLLLEGAPFGDVQPRPDDVARATACLAHHPQLVPDPHHGAVLAQEAVFVRQPVRRLQRARAGHRLGAVVGMEMADPPLQVGTGTGASAATCSVYSTAGLAAHTFIRCSDVSRNACSTRRRAVMSRAIFATPTIRPWGSRIGERVTET